MSMQKANKNEVRKEIADLINRIKEQSDRIGTQREIPQSELDLILHRIEELHRKTVVWSFLNELPVESPAEKQEKAVEPPPVLPNINSPSGTLGTGAQSDKKELPSQPVIEEVKKIEPIVVAPPVVPEVVQPIAEPKTDLSERVETKVEKVESVKQLKDVKTFVGFNEKLMYIRQVFGGNSDAYNAALDQINTMNSWTEAESFLGVLAAEYKWGKDSEPVSIFIHTVKRRFS